MNDDKADKIIALLEDIKVGQQQHVENYQVALQNQAESIQRQSEAVALQKRAMQKIPLLVVLAVVVIGLICLLIQC